MKTPAKPEGEAKGPPPDFFDFTEVDAALDELLVGPDLPDKIHERNVHLLHEAGLLSYNPES